MGEGPELETERLLLRRWREQDSEPFAAMNADPLAMRFFPSVLSTEQSDELIEIAASAFERDGFGLWAVESREDGRFAGFIGLAPVPADLTFAPAIEIGWRMSPAYWGRGLATEGASAVVDFAFGEAGLKELLAYTAAVNSPSRRLMERLGMRHDRSLDFMHPRVQSESELAPHVVYRLEAPSV